jgi:SAM-dependent methyltransferase
MARTYVLAVIGLLIFSGTPGSVAQTPPGQPAGHPHMDGHHPGQMPGRDVHHSFGSAETWAKEFDDPARDAWQKPEEILDALDLHRAARVADIGAGTGYFSARIAKRVPDGKVFAVDIEPDMLRYLAERKHREHLHPLEPVQAGIDSANLPEPVDLALLVDTYHHVANRIAYFSRLKDSLRPNGRIAVVDFKAGAPDGPLPEQRVPPEKVTEELAAAGYSLVASHPFLPRQYFLVFRRNAP